MYRNLKGLTPQKEDKLFLFSGSICQSSSFFQANIQGGPRKTNYKWGEMTPKSGGLFQPQLPIFYFRPFAKVITPFIDGSEAHLVRITNRSITQLHGAPKI